MPDLLETFLQGAGWGGARRSPLAGDASARRYQRLHAPQGTAVLMIAPPGDEFTRFQRVDAWLLQQGFSAPRILAAQPQHGLMLLEDFGDDLLARLLVGFPEAEPHYYAAITDFLLALHRLSPPDFVAPLDAADLGALVALVPQWYPLRSPTAAADLQGLVAQACAGLAPVPPVLSLRDFHAENVIWLPARQGPARLGLLDFQDAVATHPAYDLVSALQDARRDLPASIVAQEQARYAALAGHDRDELAKACAVIGAQRALRILGIFARLCLCQGKADYLRLMPRVWANLRANLAHEALAPLRGAVQAGLLLPDDDLLNRMRQECGHHPMR